MNELEEQNRELIKTALDQLEKIAKGLRWAKGLESEFTGIAETVILLRKALFGLSRQVFKTRDRLDEIEPIFKYARPPLWRVHIVVLYVNLSLTLLFIILLVTIGS